jgi:hypothetical protein
MGGMTRFAHSKQKKVAMYSLQSLSLFIFLQRSFSGHPELALNESFAAARPPQERSIWCNTESPELSIGGYLNLKVS